MISPAADRILTLDAIRGVAVMGILVMNIIGFAMPEAAYSNPLAYGTHSSIDLAAWLISFVLIDGKMRGLFSFLFGASMLLVIDRAETKGERAAVIHYARMMWLFAFGMAHLVLLWWGDILNHYALVGAIAFLFRRLAVHQLVAVAILLLGVEFALVFSVAHQIVGDQAAVLAHHASAEQLHAYMANRANLGVPPAADIQQDLSLYRSDYAAIVAHRWPQALHAPGQAFFFLGMETLAYMLLGMAGLRSGMLTGAWSRSTYARGAILGLGVGIAVTSLIAMLPMRHGFDTGSVAMATLAWTAIIRPVMIAGWACLIVLLVRPGGALTRRVAAAGRMAFTNYLATSLICTTIFYGYGLGLYGRLGRAECYLVVVAICLAMLGWSAPWLARFRYGPLEWLWRSLARARLQPMRR